MKVFSNTKIKLLLKRSQRTLIFHKTSTFLKEINDASCEDSQITFLEFTSFVDLKKNNLTMSLQCKKTTTTMEYKYITLRIQIQYSFYCTAVVLMKLAKGRSYCYVFQR